MHSTSSSSSNSLPTAPPPLRPSSSSASQAKRRHRDSDVQPPFPSDPKRARPGTTDPPPPAMAPSAKAMGKRPAEPIDLTGDSSPSNGSTSSRTQFFSRPPVISSGSLRNNGSSTVTVNSKRPLPYQPHAGAQKLVIKNLRVATPARKADVDEYYVRAWNDLDDALSHVFAGQLPTQPFEKLYRGVEDLCRHGQDERLAKSLHGRCEKYIEQQVLSQIRSDAAGQGADNVVMLRVVLAHWKTWSKQLALIRGMFSWLDRSFLLNSRTMAQINDDGIGIFRKTVIGNKKETEDGLKVLSGMCQLIEYDRRGDDRFDSTLLKESVTMLNIFGVYTKLFEPMFLQVSRVYFKEFAEDKSSSGSLKNYIVAVEGLLKREDFRCVQYNFDSTTKRQLMDSAHSILIEDYAQLLLDNGSVGKLIDDNEVESLKALYALLRLSGIQSRLKEPWSAYIQNAGKIIVTDKERDEEMVIRLLELRKKLDMVVRDAFDRDEQFVIGLRNAFGSFINDKTNQSVWKTGTSKAGEMIAKYIDMLLRGGLKTLPRTLLSDSKDRADDEKSGLASTADEDAELDRQLDNALELFRFIQGKDVFEAFYKKDLARRLLMGRSASQDAERNMLAKLKGECGSTFTHNLEQMFKDIELGKEEMSSYKQWSDGTGKGKRDIDLNVSILSAAAWPPYQEVKMRLPEEVIQTIDDFDKYYRKKHTGRKLSWKHTMAHCMVKAHFNKGSKELMVSAPQAVVLVLFNQAEASETNGILTYEQIKEATRLEPDLLKRTLQSLACAKIRPLTKAPKGRDVNEGDTFVVNQSFSHPMYRIKINQIQLKETKEENKETHERVAQDRQFETQAAIVRIMKARQKLPHVQLVQQVIEQTIVRGAVDPVEIKKNIEKLIEKDYLEREGNSYVYLA